jgi:hypothetical protein
VEVLEREGIGLLAFTWSEPKPLIMLRVMQGMDGNDDDPTRGLKYNCSDLDEI